MNADEYQELDALQFLENPRNDARVADCQVIEADDALTLFFFNFLGKAGRKTASTEVILDMTVALHKRPKSCP